MLRTPRWNPPKSLFPEISVDNFDFQYSYCGINFDTVDGIGSFPNNQNIAYRGFTVIMPIKQYHKLAMPLSWNVKGKILNAERRDSLEYLIGAVKDGTALGPPTLYIETDPAGDDLSEGVPLQSVKVTGHEGRHRMLVMSRIGCADAPVQIIGRNFRARHLKGRPLRDLLLTLWTNEAGDFKYLPVTGLTEVYFRP